MFVCNVKLNSKSIVKIGLIIIAVIVVIFFIISLYKILSNSFKVRDEVQEPDIAYLTADEYTNVLKSVYENIDIYIGQKICFSGYVYRCIDFSDTQFVLARDMLLEGSTKSLIVGFLCSYKEANKFSNNTWVTITGEITKGNYHGEIPIIKVIEMKEISKPADEFCYPPDSTYIPTSIIY